MNAPQYARTIEEKVQGVQGFAVARLASITKELGGKRPTTTPRAATPTLAIPSAPTTADQRRLIPVEVVQGSTSPFAIARTVLEPILGPLETTVIVLIVAIFVLMQKEHRRRLLSNSRARWIARSKRSFRSMNKLWRS